MKKKLLSFMVLLILSVMVAGCGGSKETPKTEITVSAASSLKEALGELQSIYSNKQPDVKVTFNFGSSGTLQQQIEQGAPVDLFISAGKKQMDGLENKNLIKKSTRKNIIGNEIVLVVGNDNTSITSFQDLTKPEVKHISIGNPESVPAGKYGQEALTSMKLWDTLQNKLVQGKDVKQVLAYVETGNAEAGLVYNSDAQVSNKVKIASIAQKDTHKPIVYPAALISTTKNVSETEGFLKFLQSEEAMKVFIKYGFKELKK